ncbi:MAG: thioredoxin domain-containing protein [Alphaproteobacteria bacterium]|nr:thioredoxin domain-containing protein [Alphaproteobacteria bacterium]
MSLNRLAGETSPYLRQHKDNPVHWHPWGDAALTDAKAMNKPVLLSIGYAACHWCHVMAHESFEDPNISAQMNDLFVNIKVDREERPDLDIIYQAALNMLGEQGGWPLTIFMTPDGDPFWGGTYFPPVSKFGRPGFGDVLSGISDVYHDNPDRVKTNVAALRDGMAALSKSEQGDLTSIGTMNRIADRLVQENDLQYGGIGSAPKFPQGAIYEQLWRAWKRTEKPEFKEAVTVTLNNICQGGIYDHLRGGFSRYSTDDRWLAPHFEKMLYDNAQLIDLLTLVWQDTRDPLYEQRVAETIDWLQAEMLAPGGGFASALDADSEGVEGKYYVWSAKEIDDILGADAPLFRAFYNITPEGNWEGKCILNRLAIQQLSDAATEENLRSSRKTLLVHRQTRIPPGKDNKILTDWNGLIIAALANAGLVFDKPDWVNAARQAFTFVLTNMTNQDRLWHSWCDERPNHPATLDDYAAMARAALGLFEATGETDYLAHAQHWVKIADRHYWDEDAGGYFFAADDTSGLIARTKSANDNAVPSGNGVLANVCARLYFLTGDNAYYQNSEAIITAFSGALKTNFFPLSTLVNSAEFLRSALQIVIVATHTDAATLTRAVYDLSLPNKLVSIIPPGAALPASHPAHGKGQIEGAPTAYVCRGPVCSQPVITPAELTQNLLATP